MMKNKQLLGFLALLLTAFIFGSFGIFIRWLHVDLGTYQQILFRNIIAFFLLILYILLFHRIKINLKSLPIGVLFLFTLGFFGSVIFFTIGSIFTKIIIAVCGLYIGSVIGSLIIGGLFFHEKMTIVKTLSIILVIIGLIFFMYPLSWNSVNIGLLFGLGAGFCDAIANSCRKYFDESIDRFATVLLNFICGMIISVILMIIFNQFSIPIISTMTWVVGVVFGICLIIINFLLLYGFKHMDLNLGTIVLSAELLFAAIFAIFIFQEIPTVFEIIGSICVAVAIVVPYFKFPSSPKGHDLLRT